MSRTEWTDAEKAQLREDAIDLIIPHFASNAELSKGPKVFVRGEGCFVWDLDGNRYFDSFATLLTTVCGHVRPEVTQAVREQMELLEFFPNYVDAFTVPLIELARKLKQLMPGDLGVSFFVNSGSEANETALKMARQYHLERGEPHRFKFIARRDSYHATTLGAGAVTGLRWFREYFEPLMPGALFVNAARRRDVPEGMSEADYTAHLLAEIEKLIGDEGAQTIAGFIMDPLPGSNTGYPLPPEGYLQGVRELCDRHGILLIFDEVQTGFGHTGKWFFCEHEGVTPDIMTVGKGFTGGFIPLAATVTTPRVAEVFRRGPGTELRSGSTYGGHTVACAATLANIGIIESENLVENARLQGEYLKSRMDQMREQHPIVGTASGIGLLWALQLDVDPKLGVGTWIRDWCYSHEMILRNNGDILVLAPSLVLTRDEADFMLDHMEEAIVAAQEHYGVG
ncbi:MAG TPA: aspartate aminotransferase family protein [Armatimonadetes bacterium]|jgi:adenosylmethionine-8-amino-7-oxononanoate aminotransferase|nr:aspartate aminotransferase family protein [Armatimonadota bacterium]